MPRDIRDIERKLKKLDKEGKVNTDQFGNILNEYWNTKEFEQRSIQLKPLKPYQQEAMKIEHFKLHLPATATKEQLHFIHSIARSVILNEPITVVHNKAIQYLLRWAYSYRNTLVEFDEANRWSDSDDEALNKISREFKPILNWLVENYKLNIKKFRRD